MAVAFVERDWLLTAAVKSMHEIRVVMRVGTAALPQKRTFMAGIVTL